jgi:hypothetical protein
MIWFIFFMLNFNISSEIFKNKCNFLVYILRVPRVLITTWSQTNFLVGPTHVSNEQVAFVHASVVREKWHVLVKNYVYTKSLGLQI